MIMHDAPSLLNMDVSLNDEKAVYEPGLGV